MACSYLFIFANRPGSLSHLSRAWLRPKIRLMSFAHTGFQGFGASRGFAKIPQALEHSTLSDFEEHPFVLSFGDVRKVRCRVDRLDATISLHDSEG